MFGLRPKVAAVLLVVSCLQLAGGADAQRQEHYYVGGKEVTPQMYRAGELVNESMGLMRSGQNQEAVDKLTEALKLAPDMPEAHHNLGLALAKVGRSAEAIEQLNIALAARPDLESTWVTLGGINQSMGRLDEAIRLYREFLTRFPKSPQVPRLASLAKGLEGELKRQRGANGSQGNAQAMASDYYSEIIKQGRLRWPVKRMPLKVNIKPGTGIPGYRDPMTEILKGSFEDWATASGGRVRFLFVDDPSQADIQCSWTDNPRVLSNSAEAGEARLYQDPDGISKGTIQLLTVPLSIDLPLTDNRLRVNCLHEIGHVLGLAGHTTNPQDIMFYSSPITDKWRLLSPRDSRTIIVLYSN